MSSPLTPDFSSEELISAEHIRLIQTYTECITSLHKLLGYNASHNNCYREKAAVALDQMIYPDLFIRHNTKMTGPDAIDHLGRSREYKKIELGPGYKKPFDRTYLKDASVKKRRRGEHGFQPSKLFVMLSRFRDVAAQDVFVKNNALVISAFFAENAMPSISYVITGEANLKKIVEFYNLQVTDTPKDTNKWSYNNVRIPMTWMLEHLDQKAIDIIVMVNGKHKKVSVEHHDAKYVGANLNPSGFYV
jgi:hypothetical protein